MLKLLERNVSNVDRHLTVLASPRAERLFSFNNVAVDSCQYGSLLSDIQRLRGKIYLGDGAIGREELTHDGRHDTPEDHKSWHVVMHDERHDVTGCIWYLEHAAPSFEALRLRHSPLAQSDMWSAKLKSAVEQDIARAKRERVSFAEVGGWAVSKDSHMTDCLLLILGTYALSQVLGGAYVTATATVRHSSAAILRRLGGAPFANDGEEIPSYYDPRYGCAMELLRFDTRRPATKFVRLVDCLKAEFSTLPVLAMDPHPMNSAQTTLGSAHMFGGQHFQQRSVA
jgi:hypothetical protein